MFEQIGYSCLSDSTGFVLAVLSEWNPTVKNEKINARIVTIPKVM